MMPSRISGCPITKSPSAAAAQRRAVDRGHERGADAVHAQQQLVEALERQHAGRGGAPDRARAAGHPRDRAHGMQRGAGLSRCDPHPRGPRRGEQLAHVVVGQEALRVGSVQDDRADALVALDLAHQRVELGHHRIGHQAMRRVRERGHDHAAVAAGDHLARAHGASLAHGHRRGA
jgi:hypothetical protein